MRFLVALTTCALLLGGPLSAQAGRQIPLPDAISIDPATLSDAELLDLLERLEQSRAPLRRRVSLFAVPAAFGLPKGMWFVSAAATNRRDRIRAGDWDASLAFGFGLGDPVNAVGITPVIDITSVSPYHFGESGKVGVKISRELSLGTIWRGAASLDVDNLLTWGDSRVLDPEWTLTLSAVRPAGPDWAWPVILSAGIGSGVKARSTSAGWFAGAGIGLGENWGASLGWYGDEAVGGLNVWAGQKRNLQISLGIGDIGNNVSGRRLLVAMSFARPFGKSD